MILIINVTKYYKYGLLEYSCEFMKQNSNTNSNGSLQYI